MNEIYRAIMHVEQSMRFEWFVGGAVSAKRERGIIYVYNDMDIYAFLE